MARSVLATVHTTSPLTLYFDGDTTNPVPAIRSRSYTPVTGDRVWVALRTPLPPLIQAKAGS
jgi:hypothetical protein